MWLKKITIRDFLFADLAYHYLNTIPTNITLTTTCWQLSFSSAASRSATKASLDPSGRICGGRAMYSVRPMSTVSQQAVEPADNRVLKVRRCADNGGPPLAPGASGPPQRPCAQRHVETIGLRGARGATFTGQQPVFTRNY